MPSYPGEKHPNALVLFGQPSTGVSLDTLDQAFQKEVQGLIHNGPTAKEMARIKKVGAAATCPINSLDARDVPAGRPLHTFGAVYVCFFVHVRCS